MSRSVWDPNRYSGHRWRIQPLGDDLGVWWGAFRLFERVEGIAPDEQNARSAVEHFLISPHTYTLGDRAAPHPPATGVR